VKFHSETDAQKFLVEIGMINEARTASKDLEVTDEMRLMLKKARGILSDRLKNHRKSQSSKLGWKRHGHEIMRGIKAYHRSTAGKRFHRQMSRFLVRKTFDGLLSGRKHLFSESNYSEISEALKALSCVKTHLFIELGYYHPMYEQVGLELFVMDYCTSAINEIEQCILHNRNLNEEQYNLLFLLTEVNPLINTFAKETGKSVDDIESMWKKIKTSLKKQGHNEDDKNFYALLVGSLKNALKLK